MRNTDGCENLLLHPRQRTRTRQSCNLDCPSTSRPRLSNKDLFRGRCRGPTPRTRRRPHHQTHPPLSLQVPILRFLKEILQFLKETLQKSIKKHRASPANARFPGPRSRAWPRSRAKAQIQVQIRAQIHGLGPGLGPRSKIQCQDFLTIFKDFFL